MTLNNRILRAGITRIRETFIKLPYCCFTYTYYIEGLSLEPPTGDVTMLHNSNAPALVFKIILKMLKAFKMAQYTINSGVQGHANSAVCDTTYNHLQCYNILLLLIWTFPRSCGQEQYMVLIYQEAKDCNTQPDNTNCLHTVNSWVTTNLTKNQLHSRPDLTNEKVWLKKTAISDHK